LFAVPSYTNEATIACMNSSQESVDQDKWKNCCQRTERTILQHAAECVETLTRGSHPPVDIEVGGADDDSADAGDPLDPQNPREAHFSPIRPRQPDPELEGISDLLPPMEPSPDPREVR